jgi:hypothetical protein
MTIILPPLPKSWVPLQTDTQRDRHRTTCLVKQGKHMLTPACIYMQLHKAISLSLKTTFKPPFINPCMHKGDVYLGWEHLYERTRAHKGVEGAAGREYLDLKRIISALCDDLVHLGLDHGVEGGWEKPCMVGSPRKSPSHLAKLVVLRCHVSCPGPSLNSLHVSPILVSKTCMSHLSHIVHSFACEGTPIASFVFYAPCGCRYLYTFMDSW